MINLTWPQLSLTRISPYIFQVSDILPLFFQRTWILGQASSESRQVFIYIDMFLFCFFLLLTFFGSVLVLNTRSLTFLVANFTKICLGLPAADLPTRWDTAISLGSTWGSTLISLQIFRTASSVLSCSFSIEIYSHKGRWAGMVLAAG